MEEFWKKVCFDLVAGPLAAVAVWLTWREVRRSNNPLSSYSNATRTFTWTAGMR